jgi:hypothetical protein
MKKEVAKVISKEEMQEKRKEIMKELRRERNKKYYQDTKDKNKMLCECCCLRVDKHYYERHCETRIHKRLFERSKNPDDI